MTDELFPGVDASSTHVAAPLSQAELMELDELLSAETLPEETMCVSGVDGYLAAIAAGPRPIRTEHWLPGIWWGADAGDPTFASPRHATRAIDLITRHLHGIAHTLQHDPQGFEPLVEIIKPTSQDVEILDGGMWAYGFMQGAGLLQGDWRRLFRDPTMLEVVRPIHLLGSDDLSPEEDRMICTARRVEALTMEIPAALMAIYRYWHGPAAKSAAGANARAKRPPGVRVIPVVAGGTSCDDVPTSVTSDRRIMH